MNTIRVSDAATDPVVITLEDAGFDVEYNSEADEFIVSNPPGDGDGE